MTNFDVIPKTIEDAKKFISENLIGSSGKIKASTLFQPYFVKSHFCKWLLDITADQQDISVSGRLHLVLENLPKCEVCNNKIKSYFNGVLKTCGSDECVKTAKSLSMKSKKRPRSEKQKQFIRNNLQNFLHKSKETIKKKYGVDNPYQIKSVIEKARDGHKRHIKTTETKRNLQNIENLSTRFGIKVENIESTNSKWITYTCECGFSEEKTFYTLTNRKQKTGNSCAKCSGVLNGSIEQKKLFDFVNTFVYAEQNNRKILAPYEIDIWIPSLNLGIEYNGIFWHSNRNVEESNRYYHQEKALEAKKRGIKLIQVWSHWDLEKIKNIILHHLNQSTKIYARNTVFSRIDKKDAYNLLKDWHLDESIPAKDAFALYYKDEPVSIVLIGKSRFAEETELLRFASKPGFSVVGGLSKLIKNSMDELRIDKLTSFARLEFTGNAYEKAGAKLISITPPAENWINLKTGKILSRLAVQKHKLKNLLETFDENLSAHKNLEMNNWRVFWYAGNQKFVFSKHYSTEV